MLHHALRHDDKLHDGLRQHSEGRRLEGVRLPHPQRVPLGEGRGGGHRPEGRRRRPVPGLVHLGEDDIQGDGVLEGVFEGLGARGRGAQHDLALVHQLRVVVEVRLLAVGEDVVGHHALAHARSLHLLEHDELGAAEVAGAQQLVCEERHECARALRGQLHGELHGVLVQSAVRLRLLRRHHLLRSEQDQWQPPRLPPAVRHWSARHRPVHLHHLGQLALDLLLRGAAAQLLHLLDRLAQVLGRVARPRRR
mmetsp:Transcript_27300/g.59633  ORF Transcript_27300/g.59633 Transcript_27300/m.59633 type:complete len:251 (+) Transcript_27300:1320-2072(+)